MTTCTIKPQILAAISGAISAYIADEEAAGQTAALTAMAAAAPGPPISLWALAGRQPGHAAQAADAAPEFEVM